MKRKADAPSSLSRFMTVVNCMTITLKIMFLRMFSNVSCQES